VSNNNFYFETLQQTQGELTDEVLSGRIAEITRVLSELTNTTVWNVLLHDSKALVKQLDDCWQEIDETSPKFKEARILKMASKHIFDLPFKYAQELDMLQAELVKRQNPEEIIEKDTDNE
jgi:hypothetical protein